MVRRRVAGLRGTPPLHRSGDRRSPPWALAPQLAVVLRGQEGLQHRTRWFYGYWPEVVPAVVGEGSFVWGHCRGYPVAVHIFPAAGGELRGRFMLYVAAMSLPARPWRSNGQYIERSLAGYHVNGMLDRWLTVESVARLIDQACEMTQRDGLPPAPYVEPLV